MDAIPHDLELRLVDPAKNRFRLYGLTVCRTLFGELCLRIVWGRIGNRSLRERSEVFSDEDALERRRRELLARRQRHGYVAPGQPAATAGTSPTRSPRSRRGETPRFVAPSTLFAPTPCPLATPLTKPESVQREIVEAHGLSLADKVVRQLVDDWLAATKALARYLEERRPEDMDLVDVSTLASLYVEAAAAA